MRVGLGVGGLKRWRAGEQAGRQGRALRPGEQTLGGGVGQAPAPAQRPPAAQAGRTCPVRARATAGTPKVERSPPPAWMLWRGAAGRKRALPCLGRSRGSPPACPCSSPRASTQGACGRAEGGKTVVGAWGRARWGDGGSGGQHPENHEAGTPSNAQRCLRVDSAKTMAPPPAAQLLPLTRPRMCSCRHRSRCWTCARGLCGPSA